MKKTGLGYIRIIAGTLRGSKLPVLDQPGLRPSSDRVRETLFNWLQHHVQGSKVLDLFAGSGALGFEAISRQARHVTLVEKNQDVCELLEMNKKRLNINNTDIVQNESLSWLKNTQQSGFDIVFLDPPYASNHWSEIWLHLKSKVSLNALIYIEIGHGVTLEMPVGLEVLKQGKTQQSNYFLTKWKN